MRLQNRTAVVTGGARGIGAAVVRELAGAGAAVIIADVREEEGKALAAQVGGQATFHRLDVTDAGQWRSLINAAEQRFGPVAVLVNNAGTVEFGAIEEQDPASFRREIEVDLVGPWLGMQAALPSMRRAGEGCVVNMSSTAGLMGYVNLGSYVASKWGLRGLTKTAALEFAADRVRVCSVHPGPIRSAMTAGMEEEMVAGQPIHRFGVPEEVARMVRFIITEATYSTGSEFVIDGGAASGVPEEASGA